jgi:predicted DNA-binding protein
VTDTTSPVEGSSMFKLKTAMLQRVRSYAKESGKSASTVVNEAMETWYDLHGEVVLEEMIKRNSRKRSAR